MKKLILLLAAAFLSCNLHSETAPETYAEYGRLICVKLPSAPFPHPERAQGRTRNNIVYPAEKHYQDSSVALFVPKGFRAGDKVDFVVHFHGWNNYVERVLTKYELIKQFSESGRNAILVVPQGPYDAPDSFDGKLEDEGGFNRFMDDVMSTLRKGKVINSQPLGRIILSGHSGGYQVISSIVTVGGLSDHVKEVWLFDALYARTEKFMDWHNQQHGKMINLFTEHGGTKQENETLMADLKKKNISFVFKNESAITPPDLKKNDLIFVFTDLEHDLVVNQRHEFRTYLETSCLANKNLAPSYGPKWTRR
ncbi:hypothetical protein [Pedosphaera parvula]|nr:hypothetical protein [Pedosphaera parvula]